MGLSVDVRENVQVTFSANEVTGAVGDSVTVLPIVVAVSLVTELSLAVMLVWFGVFQVVWGLYYGVPVSVEPMKALAALVLAGAIATAELLLAGLLLGGILLLVGGTGSLARIHRLIGRPVVRGIQLGVALVLLETGLRLGLGDPRLAAVGLLVALAVIATGRWNLSPFVVLVVGALMAASEVGLSTALGSPVGSVSALSATLTADSGVVSTALFSALAGVPSAVSLSTLEATLAQLAMTLGNAAFATALLLSEYFDREVSADQLCSSMGTMNLAAVPLGGFPMCHGSGGVAGKYAFGARTAGSNVFLGIGYVALAVLAVDLVSAYPMAVLGVILALIALQLGRTSIRDREAPLLVVGIGLVGVLVNLGVAFVFGVLVSLALERQVGRIRRR